MEITNEVEVLNQMVKYFVPGEVIRYNIKILKPSDMVNKSDYDIELKLKFAKEFYKRHLDYWNGIGIEVFHEAFYSEPEKEKNNNS